MGKSESKLEVPNWNLKLPDNEQVYELENLKCQIGTSS
jgi:hypothetical protein